MSLNFIIKRSISITVANYGKRNFKKFQIFNKRGSRTFKKQQMENPDPELFHTRGLRPVGYNDDNGKFVLIPEKIPELIVPDLTGCKLKPYVSYKTPEIIQSEFTAQDLFNVVYAPKIAKDFEEGNIDDQGNPKQPSEEEKLSPELARIQARQTGSDIF